MVCTLPTLRVELCLAHLFGLFSFLWGLVSHQAGPFHPPQRCHLGRQVYLLLSQVIIRAAIAANYTLIDVDAYFWFGNSLCGRVPGQSLLVGPGCHLISGQ